jgi:hypothetical protein
VPSACTLSKLFTLRGALLPSNNFADHRCPSHHDQPSYV